MSCHPSRDPSTGWRCHSTGAGGAIQYWDICKVETCSLGHGSPVKALHGCRRQRSRCRLARQFPARKHPPSRLPCSLSRCAPPTEPLQKSSPLPAPLPLPRPRHIALPTLLCLLPRPLPARRSPSLPSPSLKALDLPPACAPQAEHGLSPRIFRRRAPTSAASSARARRAMAASTTSFVAAVPTPCSTRASRASTYVGASPRSSPPGFEGPQSPSRLPFSNLVVMPGRSSGLILLYHY